MLGLLLLILRAVSQHLLQCHLTLQTGVRNILLAVCLLQQLLLSLQLNATGEGIVYLLQLVSHQRQLLQHTGKTHSETLVTFHHFQHEARHRLQNIQHALHDTLERGEDSIQGIGIFL